MAQLSVQHGKTRTAPDAHSSGDDPSFLRGFYCHFDLIAEDIISRKNGWSILIHGRFFTIKFSGAIREIILRETIGGIDGFSGLQQRRKVRI